jgi:hypothetical protein
LEELDGGVLLMGDKVASAILEGIKGCSSSGMGTIVDIFEKRQFIYSPFSFSSSFDILSMAPFKSVYAQDGLVKHKL